MRDGILIFGAGKLAKCVADALLLSDVGQEIVFVDRAAVPGARVIGLPVLDESEVLNSRGNEPSRVVVAIGDNWQREKLVARIVASFAEVAFPKIIHRGAHVSPFANLADGVIALAGAVINPSAVVGRHSVLWSNSVVEHDCELADFTTLSPGVALGGCVKLGERSFMGVGSCVRHDATIGRGTIIAAGATVVSNIEDDVIYAGTPARLLRRRMPGESYL